MINWSRHFAFHTGLTFLFFSGCRSIAYYCQGVGRFKYRGRSCSGTLSQLCIPLKGKYYTVNSKHHSEFYHSNGYPAWFEVWSPSPWCRCAQEPVGGAHSDPIQTSKNLKEVILRQMKVSKWMFSVHIGFRVLAIDGSFPTKRVAIKRALRVISILCLSLVTSTMFHSVRIFVIRINDLVYEYLWSKPQL